MDKILHDPKDPKLWELWYIPYNGYCRILSINRSLSSLLAWLLQSSWSLRILESGSLMLGIAVERVNL